MQGSQTLRPDLPVRWSLCWRFLATAVLVLATLLSAAPAQPASIVMTTTARAWILDGRLRVDLAFHNGGDAAATALEPTLRFSGLAVTGARHPRLAPGETLETALEVTPEGLGPGTWPFRVDLSYRDAGGTLIHALHVGTVALGTISPEEVAVGTIEATPLTDSGALTVEVRNLGEVPRALSLKVDVPEGLEARPDPPAELQPGETRFLTARLENRSVPAGSRIAAFAVVEYDSGGFHQSVVELATIEIETPPAAGGIHPRGRLRLIGLLALLWLVVVALRWKVLRGRDPAAPRAAASRSRELVRAAVDAGAVLASVGFAASYFPLSLLLAPTTASGGDMASHVYTAAYLRDVLLPSGQLLGWCPGNYAGFPFLQFYFPLPFLLMAALSLALPLEIAFKLVTVLGTLLLPVCAYLGLRLLGSPFPGPALGAVGSLCFLFMEANSMWGGNIPSTLAGEFTFSLGLALAVLFVGSLRWAVRTRRGRLRNGVLVALIGFAHGYALLWAGLVSLLELVTTRGWWRRLRTLVAVHGIATLLLAFWLAPLLWYTPWTTAFNPVWHIRSWQEILPPILWPAAALALLASLLTAVVSLRRNEVFPRALGTLWGAVALSLFFYLTAHSFHVVDIRFMPFFQIGLCLLAAASVAQVVSRLPAAEVWPLLALLAVVPFVQSQVRFIPGWVEWNYSGFEAKPGWPVFRAINRHLRGDSSDPRVAWEHSPDHERLGTVRAFESLPHFSGRSTLEGVYMQASVTAPFVFYIQSEISRVTSCPFPEWGCGRLDLERGLAHLKLFNVSHLILRSDEAKRAAEEQTGLRREASLGDYEVHRVLGNDDRYAAALPVAPVLVETRKWKQTAYRWFKQARAGDPIPVFATRVAAAERDRFAGAYADLPDEWPLRSLDAPPRLTEQIDVDRITVTGCRPGHPILVRISYHPRWRALSGERIWLAGPGLMLVFPLGERVELAFGDGPVLFWGRLASALGLGILVLHVLPPGRRLRKRVELTVSRLLVRGPVASALEWARRSSTWSPRRRRAALGSGLTVVVSLLILFAVAASTPDADSTYRQAQELFDAGRLEEAAGLFREAQALAPLSMTAIHSRYYEAISYFKMERWNEAEERFLALVESFPEAPNVAEDLWHVGLCRQRMEDPGGAAAVWTRLVEEFPHTQWAGYARERLAALEPPA